MPLYTLADAIWPGPVALPAAYPLEPPRVFNRGPFHLGVKKTLTLAVDGSTVRAVAFDAKRVAAWASIELDGPGPFTLPEQFNAYLGRSARQVGDLPFYAALTRFMDKPAVRKRYLGQVIAAESAGALPFDQSEVDFVWREFRDGRGPEVMISATPRWEVDAHLELLGTVGVRPAALYAKSAALALAVGLPNIVIAHLDGSTAEMVLVRDGVPRDVHRVELSPTALPPDEYADALEQAIDELTTFDHDNHGADGSGPSSERAPIEGVVLTGLLPASDQISRALRQALGARLRHASAPILYPDDFPASEYATNVGLAVADWGRYEPPWRKADPGRLAIDLLPQRHRIGTIPWKALRYAAFGLLLAAMAVGATGLSRNAEANVASLEQQVASLEIQARVGRNQAAQLNRESALAQAVGQQTEALIAQEQSRRTDTSVTLERLRLMSVDSPLRRVRVSAIDLGGGQIKLSGNAPSFEMALRTPRRYAALASSRPWRPPSSRRAQRRVPGRARPPPLERRSTWRSPIPPTAPRPRFRNPIRTDVTCARARLLGGDCTNVRQRLYDRTNPLRGPGNRMLSGSESRPPAKATRAGGCTGGSGWRIV